MKTKSDIIKGQLMTSKLTPIQWNGILISMDQFAEQQSINFANWIEANGIENFGTYENPKWNNWVTCKDYTTKELYESYLTSLKKPESEQKKEENNFSKLPPKEWFEKIAVKQNVIWGTNLFSDNAAICLIESYLEYLTSE